MRPAAAFLCGFLFAHGLVYGVARAVESVFRPSESGGLVTQTDQRAPNSKETGVFWMYKNGSSIDVYIKDWISGDWRGPVTF